MLRNVLYYGTLRCYWWCSIFLSKAECSCLSFWSHIISMLLPPATKLGQGNIFSSVCQGFCPRGQYLGRYPLACTPPWAGTPPQFVHWAGGTHPTGMHSCYLSVFGSHLPGKTLRTASTSAWFTSSMNALRVTSSRCSLIFSSASVMDAASSNWTINVATHAYDTLVLTTRKYNGISKSAVRKAAFRKHKLLYLKKILFENQLNTYKTIWLKFNSVLNDYRPQT